MTIKQITGDLLAASGVLVHGCNCQGVMGGGVALHIRNKWPDVFTAYRNRFLTKGLRLGEAVVVASAHDKETASAEFASLVDAWTDQLPSGVVVVNLMTQDRYGRDPNKVYVDYPALQAGFAQHVAPLAKAAALPVCFPAIGCGLANGEWKEVAPRIEQALGPAISKTLYVHNG